VLDHVHFGIMDNKDRSNPDSHKLLSLSGNCISSLFWLTSSTKTKNRKISHCAENQIAPTFIFCFRALLCLRSSYDSLYFVNFYWVWPAILKFQDWERVNLMGKTYV